MDDSSLALLLARVQFAFTISFHIIFPAFTIGLASYLVVLEALWLRRRQDVYLQLYRYWSRIFALSFGMGVVSGIVMSYQFGTNWGPFSDRTGAILGPLLGYEVLSAFFLEAGFLGIMLFGLNRVGPVLHFLATCMVGVGTLFSAFWILAANSWMHTPAGFVLEAGRFLPRDWLEIIFNPSFPYRFVHMLLAAYLTTAFVVGGVAAWHLLRDRHNAGARIMLSMAMWMATLVAPLQLLVGDQHGLNTLQHQPAKIAALEGHFETRAGAPLILFGWPDMEAERTRAEVSIPYLGSLILTHDPNGVVQGLKAWPADQRPNATIIFWTFRVMVGIGLLMIAVGLVSLVLRWRGRLHECGWFHRLLVLMGPAGFIAVLAGWITTEVGRQPYVVYGLLRVRDAVSPVAAPAVGASLAAFVIVYLLVFGAGIVYLLRLMAQPPHRAEPVLKPELPQRAAGRAAALGTAHGERP
ncbi:MAG: cytochrome ubiquinol oxidase subunit I [Gammaproteobacteria bacterium]|nr:cytochrome ubiquinol oxidase subunit I [Gammaproteobacteria bacterium]